MKKMSVKWIVVLLEPIDLPRLRLRSWVTC